MNIEMLRRAVAWAEYENMRPRSERQWVQDDYVIPEEHRDSYMTEVTPGCGTAYCIAGYIGMQTDERFKTSSTVWFEDRQEDVHVSDFATDMLEITEEEAELLFDGGNDIEDIRRAAASIAENHGETL